MSIHNENPPSNETPLKHPRNEEWMEYLYGEVSGERKAGLSKHLADCAPCRDQVNAWQATMQALDEGKLAPAREAFFSRPWFKLSLAAALVLGIGFGLGHFIFPDTTGSTALRAGLKAELLAELKQEQTRQFAQYQAGADERAAQAQDDLFNAVTQITDEQQIKYTALRKELETVAVLTQDKFQRQDQQITTLATISEPNHNSPLNQ